MRRAVAPPTQNREAPMSLWLALTAAALLDTGTVTPPVT